MKPPNWKPYQGGALAEQRRREKYRAAGEKRRIADPSQKRTATIITLVTPAERELVRKYAEAANWTVSDWIRAAIALVLTTRTSLPAAGLLPRKPLTVSALERESGPVRLSADPTGTAPESLQPQSAPPLHCGLAMFADADGLTCTRCGLALVRVATEA